MGAVVVATIGDRQIHAIRRGRARAERHDRVQFQFVHGTGAIRFDEFGKLQVEVRKVLPRLVGADVILASDGFYRLLFVRFFEQQIRHQRGGRVQVHDPVGVDHQCAVTVFV